VLHRSEQLEQKTVTVNLKKEEYEPNPRNDDLRPVDRYQQLLEYEDEQRKLIDQKFNAAKQKSKVAQMQWITQKEELEKKASE